MIKDDIKIRSKKHMELEIQRIVNKQLLDDKVISQDIYSKVNNSLLKKINSLAV